MFKRFFASTLVIFLFCAFNFDRAAAQVLLAGGATSILNQDGISFSAPFPPSPIGGEISAAVYNGWPDGVSLSGNSFAGGIEGGGGFWLVPHSEPGNTLVKIAPDGTMTGYDSWPEGYTPVPSAFVGGAFDGAALYLAPYDASSAAKVDAATGDITLLADWPEGFSKESGAFTGAVFDGEDIWLIPGSAKALIKISTSGAMTAFDDWPEGFLPPDNAFVGGVYDGQEIWLIPAEADRIIKFDKTSGNMQSFSNWPDGFSKSAAIFAGGIYDGQYLWLIPSVSPGVVKMNTATGQMELLNDWPDDLVAGASFAGGAFDGRYIWMAPFNANKVVRVDTFTDALSSHSLPEEVELSNGAFFGGAFDGGGVWLAPSGANEVVRLFGSNIPPTAFNVFLATVKNTPVSGMMTASDPNEGDTITFTVLTEPANGTVDAIATTGSFTYTPSVDFLGDDSFTFKASDGFEDSNTATVTISVTEAATPTPEPRKRYIDLWGHWAEGPANRLTDNGVFLGELVDEHYYFYPDYTLSRGHFVILANSTFGFKGDMFDESLPFADMGGAMEWVVMAASASFNAKMVKGVGDGDRVLFNSDEPLTRIEALAMIYNVIAPTESPTADITFADAATLPEWSLPAVRTLFDIGLLDGYEDNTVRPFNTVTRAEAIKMLDEAFNFYQNQNSDFK